MSTFPVSGYISNAARTEGEAKVAFEDLTAATKQIPGSGIAETTLTIATGSITPPGGGPGIFSIDTEAAAAQDDLANIVQTNLPDGSMLLVRPANSARVVTVKHNAGGTGQISLRTLGDFTLGDTTHWLLLKRTGTTWVEVFRGPREGVVGILSKTANYTVTQVDRGRLIDCPSGTFTLTFHSRLKLGLGLICMCGIQARGSSRSTATARKPSTAPRRWPSILPGLSIVSAPARPGSSPGPAR